MVHQKKKVSSFHCHMAFSKALQALRPIMQSESFPRLCGATRIFSKTLWGVNLFQSSLVTTPTAFAIQLFQVGMDSFWETVKSHALVGQPIVWLPLCSDGIGSDVVKLAIFTDFIVVIKDCFHPPINAPCRFAIPATFHAAGLDASKPVGLPQ